MAIQHHRLRTPSDPPGPHDEAIDGTVDNTNPKTNSLVGDLREEPNPIADVADETGYDEAAVGEYIPGEGVVDATPTPKMARDNDVRRRNAETALPAREAQEADPPWLGRDDTPDIVAGPQWGATDLNDAMRHLIEPNGVDGIVVDVTAWTDIRCVLSWLAPAIVDVYAIMRLPGCQRSATYTVRCQWSRIDRTDDGRCLVYYGCEVID